MKQVAASELAEMVFESVRASYWLEGLSGPAMRLCNGWEQCPPVSEDALEEQSTPGEE